MNVKILFYNFLYLGFLVFLSAMALMQQLETAASKEYSS